MTILTTKNRNIKRPVTIYTLTKFYPCLPRTIFYNLTLPPSLKSLILAVNWDVRIFTLRPQRLPSQDGAAGQHKVHIQLCASPRSFARGRGSHNNSSFIETLQGFHRSEDENPYISPILFYTNLATSLQGKFMQNEPDNRQPNTERPLSS